MLNSVRDYVKWDFKQLLGIKLVKMSDFSDNLNYRMTP